MKLVLVFTHEVPQTSSPTAQLLPHVRTPAFSTQTGVAPLQVVPHEPQFEAVVRSVSHVVGSASQSPIPVAHEAPQVPSVQVGVPPMAVHAIPQPLQFRGSSLSETHASSQHASSAAQSGVRTQVLPLHTAVSHDPATQVAAVHSEY
jgi:hypothetical protein